MPLHRSDKKKGAGLALFLDQIRRVLVNAFNENLFHKGIIDMYDLAPLLPSLAAGSAAVSAQQSQLGRRMNIELNFPANFEGLVLGCIDADFCK